MEIYKKNLFEPNEDDEEQRLSFINTISLETLTNAEKSIKRLSLTPIKSNISKIHLILKKSNNLKKEIISEIGSTGNNSYNNNTKVLYIPVQNKNKIIFDNNRYIDSKDNDNNNINVQQTENSQNINLRRDIFGFEIKKGGKQHISFADNVHILEARMKLEEQGNIFINKNRLSVGNNINSTNKFRKKGSFKNNISHMKNIKKNSMINSNNIKRNLVEIIEIQSYKELNKNDYIYFPEEEKKNEELDQEVVCCSKICMIY